MNKNVRLTWSALTLAGLALLGASALATESTGLGMGISISRSIAAQYGGALMISNVAADAGGGAIVELNLPALSEA